jgi:S1-C subfamily serine protease
VNPDHSDGDELRGWVDPEDRLWRHPSEQEPLNPAPGGRRRTLATAVVGVGAVVVVIAGMVLLVNTGSDVATGNMAPGTVSTLAVFSGCCKALPTVALRTERSLVSLDISTEHGTDWGCGVAAAPGGWVVTTMNELSGARSITAVTASGARVHARVVATDPGSDVALVRVDDDLPPARFTDDRTMAAGRRVMVLALATEAAPRPRAVAEWSHGTIEAVAAPVVGGDASGMAAIDAVAPSMRPMAGEVLVGPRGQIAGILDSSGRGATDGRAEVFLPAQLVIGVARDLALAYQVHHGWLNVLVHDAPAGEGGAEVAQVEPGGASAGALQPGDVILAVDGQPVRSMAELRSRIYVMVPGSVVSLRVQRAGRDRTVAVTLASSP